MTFRQLYSAVLDRTNRPDKIQLIQDNINLYLGEITNRHLWQALRSTADLGISEGSISANLPADFWKLIELRAIGVTTTDAPVSTVIGYNIPVYPKTVFTKQWPDVVAYGSGRPLAAYEENGVIYFTPKSSGSFNFRATYMFRHPKLSGDEDRTVMTEVDNAVIAFATSETFAAVQMFDAAQTWKLNAETALGQAILAEQRRPAVVVQLQKADGAGRPSTGSPEPWYDPFAGHGVTDI